jgi:hypothetical protein
MSLSKSFGENSNWWKLLLAAVLVTVVWLCLWYFPWQAKLHHIYWLQLGVGLTIFIAPGFCIYGLLNDQTNFEFNHVTFGFVLSHLVLALLGTVGRFIHISFNTVAFLIMLSGAILLLVYTIRTFGGGIKFHIDHKWRIYILSTLPIFVVVFLASLIIMQRVISDDDLTYLAYVNNWQYSTHLNFNDALFGEGVLAQPRFWLMSAPFAQALLANVSQMPGILVLGGYYDPFLVALSALAWYELALALKLSPRAASASVVLQFSFLLLLAEYLHPGSAYFDWLSTDKATAAFILAPVFFRSFIKLLEIPTRNNIVLALLTGLSLTFMHPVILAYAVSIAGVFTLLHKGNQGFRNKLVPIALLIIILIPEVVIRFVKVPSAQLMSFDTDIVLNQSGSKNVVSRWRNTRYYGFNPDILTMKIPYEEKLRLPKSLLEWGWLLIPILAVVFALNQSDKLVAQFILSAFALCFLAGFPFTGWIIGYFLNARMLARSVWLFPFGLSAVYLLSALKDTIKSNQLIQPWITKRTFLPSNWLLLTLTIFSTGLFLLFFRENNLPDFEKFKLKSIRYQDLATAGQTLDQLTPTRVGVIGSPSLNDLIPGVSSKSQLVTFRVQLSSSMAYLTSDEIKTRVIDTQKIFSRTTSASDKISLLRKYDVHFLLLQRSDLKLFNDLIATYPKLITTTEIGGVYLIQIH